MVNVVVIQTTERIVPAWILSVVVSIFLMEYKMFLINYLAIWDRIR